MPYHIKTPGKLEINDVYWKGAWILHTLRSVMNDDDIFFNVIKESQKKFRH